MLTPIENLETLSDAARQKYRMEYAAELGVPAETLKYFWNNQGDGPRSMILYVTRGATDVIRKERGITVLDIAKTDGPGYIMFTAKGQDTQGRVEMAVGVAHTENLKGSQFENQVKRAQTESLRRMTLQFVGGGLIDESELGLSVDHDLPATPLSELAKPAPVPTVAVNNEAGKDITAEPSAANVGNFLREQFSQPVIDEKKTRKPRKPRNTVDISSPGQQLEMPVGEIDKEGNITPKLPETAFVQPTLETIVEPSLDPSQFLQAVVSVSPKPTSPSAPVNLPDAEQYKLYRERISKYANDILPMSGAMMPVAGLGGVTLQLRKFFELQTGATDTQKASVDQWEEFLTFLDSYLAANGAKALVAYIRTALGVK